MPATEMIVMIAVVSAVALSFIHVVRLVGTAIIHKTVRRAVDRDPAAAESLLAELARPRQPSGDDRLSVILVALGIAMVAASVVINDPAWMHYGVAAALFPLILGTALWLRVFVMGRMGRRGGSE
jgi:hypothetical protein